MEKDAIISICGKYRYTLSRIWDSNKPLVLFIMLNPSTADGNVDDPTVRRCIGYAKAWGFGGLYIGNLFAYRSKNPGDLLLTSNPMGTKNREILTSMALQVEKIICAWGNSDIIRILNSRYGCNIKRYLPTMVAKEKYHIIQLSKDGTPKHPLYLRKNLTPQPWIL